MNADYTNLKSLFQSLFKYHYWALYFLLLAELCPQSHGQICYSHILPPFLLQSDLTL